MSKEAKKTKKKTPRRNNLQYPGLEKSVTKRVAREYLDQDYIDKLSDKDKQWLSNFNEEWLSANFNHQGKVLHKSKEKKREIYNRNNARNRDTMSILKQRGHIVQPNDLAVEADSIAPTNEKNHVEDAVIDRIDYLNKKLKT